jgi:hypothetical protein
LLGNSDVVHIEGVDAREQDALVEADLERLRCDAFQPQVDEFFTGARVGGQFDVGNASHRRQEVDVHALFDCLEITDGNRSILEFICS